MSRGMDIETALAAAELHEAANADALASRRACDAARQREFRDRKKADRNVSHVMSRESQDVTPRARVRDITSNSENNHNHTLPSANAISDDWPDGKARDHAELICAEMASPWLDQAKSPDLVTTTGQIAAWKRDGASWEHDVLPLIRGRLMNRRKPVTTWKFFTDAIAETIAANRAALAIPEAGTVIPIRPGTGPPSFQAQINEEHRLARERAFAMLDAQDGR